MLPLDRCVSQGSAADDGHCTVMVLRAGDDARAVHARVGVFFTEVVGGCSCGDDPASIPAYCELRIRIDKTTAEADIGIVPD